MESTRETLFTWVTFSQNDFSLFERLKEGILFEANMSVAKEVCRLFPCCITNTCFHNVVTK